MQTSCLRGLGILTCYIALAATAALGRAQDAAATADAPPAADATPAAAPKIEPDAPPPQPIVARLTGAIDSGFGAAVSGMQKVLLYRVGSGIERSVTHYREEFYVRDVGSAGPFRLVGGDALPTTVSTAELESLKKRGLIVDPATEITVDEAEALLARGRLVAGTDPATNESRVYRIGTLAGRKVEYVTVVASPQTRYILNEESNAYRKVVNQQRSLPSQLPEDSLSQDEMEILGAQGWLKLDPNKAESPEQQYILTQADPTSGVPLVVAWLAIGAVGFTIYFRLFNLRGFRHAIAVIRGKYDDPNEPGEVTHAQALSSALSATVGLGNIAGVTIAITMGGPGAFFWMVLCGLFGMTSKFVECTLGQMYRIVRPDGTVLGGPMLYLREGLKERGLAPLGIVLSLAFTIMCILASFGGGNMFQANQAGAALLAGMQQDDVAELERINMELGEAATAEDFDRIDALQEEKETIVQEMKAFEGTFRPVYGIVMAVLVAVVIIGGIKRIGATAEKIVPSMCGIYILACLWIIVRHYAGIPAMVQTIFTEAFSAEAFGGGLVGVAVIGIQRAAFSNEAGVGSAAIAHSAARTDEPVREGVVALLEPFIDTVIVCSMTALVIMITGAWNKEEWVVDLNLQGSGLTSRAFKEEISWFPWVLALATTLFAYSTIISWSYYGEKASETLFGPRSRVPYKVLSILAVFVGAVANLGAVIDFSDMMLLSMAFPNILGLAILAPKVKAALDDYWGRYKSGAMQENP